MKSKGFIWATILVPIGFVVFVGIVFFISIWESDTTFEIGILDETGVMAEALTELNAARYVDYSSLSADSLRSLVQQEEITGFIQMDEENIEAGKNLELIYSGSGGIQLLTSIRTDMREVIRQERLRRANVSPEIRQIYDASIQVDSRRLTRTGDEQDDDTIFLSIIGMIMGIVIFGAIFSYGGYVTRGVIEEKTSRIIEVIVSSVKPIELLTGKMAGVGALALTQFTVWILAFLGLTAVMGPVAAMVMDPAEGLANTELSEAQSEIPALLDLPAIDTSLFVYFIIFFVLGYLLYSSLFAAIGSASDSETDTQQLMLPVGAPIFIAYFIMLHTWRSPDSTLSVVSSIIPFFSPILMITRIAITEVPFWQIGLSILLMILTFAGTMWLSARIYKIGILSYGNSVGFKDLYRWIRQ
ncbi:MAG TPA: ABC transporter permease [Balneolaceae bacterium]|nr:ABC transporter permease [Balneolaceae bacterium]